jgi:hypothetical protein
LVVVVVVKAITGLGEGRLIETERVYWRGRGEGERKEEEEGD